MEKFEFKVPNLIPGKKSLKLLGFVTLSFLSLFLIWQGVKFIINYPVLSALDNTSQFEPKQINKNKDLAIINDMIELPKDQNGTVGKIKDIKALAQKKDYFKKARNGDILIIYDDMTIIYDPQNHSVVDIAKTNLLQ